MKFVFQRSTGQLRRYNRFNRTLLGFFIIYLVAALSTIFRPAARDYPFFSGHWFYRVPFHFSDYSILVKELDGVAFDPPKYIEKIYHRLPGAWPFAVYGSIQEWGRALTELRSNETALENAAVATVFRNRSFKGQLVRREMDGIEFVESGRVQSASVIKEIESK